NSRGLTNLLIDDNAKLDDYTQMSKTEGLRLLSSGPIPPNPAELLSSPRFRELVGILQETADIVIIDSPPVLVVADPIVLASQVDATVLVVDTGHTRPESARRAKEALAKSNTKLLGGILNKLDTRAGKYYYYQYSHYYHAD